MAFQAAFEDPLQESSKISASANTCRREVFQLSKRVIEKPRRDIFSSYPFLFRFIDKFSLPRYSKIIKVY